MTSPIEYLYDFSLHIHVGFVNWPDDIERYCEVTFPGGERAIKKSYIAPDYSLEKAIQRATDDIAKYMQNPDKWIEEEQA